jgi:hypothetical protein
MPLVRCGRGCHGNCSTHNDISDSKCQYSVKVHKELRQRPRRRRDEKTVRLYGRGWRTLAVFARATDSVPTARKGPKGKETSRMAAIATSEEIGTGTVKPVTLTLWPFWWSFVRALISRINFLQLRGAVCS